MKLGYRDLTYGVEVEFTYITRRRASEEVAKYFNTTYDRWHDGYDTYAIEETESKIWKVVKDSSIRPEKLKEGDVTEATGYYSCELVSPVLKYDDIRKIQELIRRLRRIGARVNNTTSIHIHVGASHMTPNSLRILCNMTYSKQDLLERALQVSKRRKLYCKSLSETFIKKINSKYPRSSLTFEEIADCWYEGIPEN